MKTKLLFALVLTLILSVTSIAQQGVNYKALIKDNNGNVVTLQEITVQFQILQGPELADVYLETHSPTTDANGIIVTNIGKGTPITGDFNAIDWASNTHSLKTEVDTGGGLTDMGTTEFMAVPYAFHAKTAESVTSAAGDNIYKFNNVTTFAAPINTSTNWTVPADVYLVYVELTGGGGGASFGAGGGGGSFASLYHQVTPGQIISYIVGGGGDRAPSSLVAGSSGNDTSISIGGNSYIAKGGSAGKGGPTGTPGSGGFNYDNDSYYSVLGQSGTANKTYYSYGPSGNTILTTEYGTGGGTYPQFLQNEGGFKSENVNTATTLRNVEAPFPSSFGSGGASNNTMSMANNGERGVVRIFY